MGLSDPRDKKFKKLIESRKLHKKKDYLILDTADIHACSTTTTWCYLDNSLVKSEHFPKPLAHPGAAAAAHFRTLGWKSPPRASLNKKGSNQKLTSLYTSPHSFNTVW